jgi:hypothetical protein
VGHESGIPARTSAGLFLTHFNSGRVRVHFGRLVRESGALVDWHFVLNAGELPPSHRRTGALNAADLLPVRYAAMRAQGRMIPGFLDLMTIPLALELDADFVWVMEFDVDWSGDWGELFARYADCDADLLVSTICSVEQCPDWQHWSGAAAPPSVDRALFRRCFTPLYRVSRAFALRYVELMADERWRGHSEFTLPTSALASGSSLVDLAGVYENNPGDSSLSPGTLVWRPVRWSYFHEQPAEFAIADRLYHPIKPWQPGRETPGTGPQRSGARRLIAARARLRRDP